MTTLLVGLWLLAGSLASCSEPSGVTFTPEERRASDSLVRAVRGVDALADLQARLEREGDRLGSIVALREWGKVLRNESRFDEALQVHSEGLRQAEAIHDTIEWVQALNHVGTDYRRLGIFDIAQEYHYRAKMLAEECSDTSTNARKNWVVSLNGLGNIYLTLRNYDRADSALRLALIGEQQLNSPIGQAINYANLGSIFEHRGQVDSAWVYYRKSMELNEAAGNSLGVSLCHTYFGSLYQQAGAYEQATREYTKAYEMMKSSKDEWHALNSLIALADIYQARGDDPKALDYLEKAMKSAERIKSREHLVEIHDLYHKYYKRQGNYRAALASYEMTATLKDSVLDMEKMNRIQNASLNIERNHQRRHIDEAHHKLAEEQAESRLGYTIFAFVVLLLIVLVGLLYYTYSLRTRSHRALKQMSTLRETFFTNITHEFRTPLTVILGLSETLRRDEDDVLPSEVKKKIQTIERQGKGLLTLINQLLDISKVKSSVGQADWCSGSITAHLTMIVETYRDYSRERNIDLQLFVRKAVEMDFIPDYINKVMNNLISNALKFTPEYGKITISVSSEAQSLLIEISDTGHGMDEETQGHIFEPFYQARSDSQNIGTGVGLALVKQIIDALEGQITVRSQVGEGTTFRISLPIRHDREYCTACGGSTSEPMLPESLEALSDSDNGKSRLLVIEDNRDVASYIGSLLEDRYSISYATNGREGLERALDLVPDLIITDLMMPEMDGLEVCRQVRANEIVNHIPIIVVTAKVTPQERVEGLEAGADAYLSKPFDSQELRTRVERLLAGRRLLRAKFAQSLLETEDAETKLQDGNAGEDERLFAQRQECSDHRFLEKVADQVYLLMDSYKKIEIPALAAHLCMSYSQFHRKLAALTGLTPQRYILRVRVQRAQQMIDRNPELSYSDVADRCGFNDYSTFVRAFKTVYGMTPKQRMKEA